MGCILEHLLLNFLNIHQHLQSFSPQLVKVITKSELVVMYVKQFSQPLTNLISECAQYATI
jgi:hypothetical protein